MALRKKQKKKVAKKKKGVIRKRLSKARPEPVEQKLQITATPEKMGGVYSNVAWIKHTESEFVLDYVLTVENSSQLVARVVVSPKHAKLIHSALGKNIKKYEDMQDKVYDFVASQGRVIGQLEQKLELLEGPRNRDPQKSSEVEAVTVLETHRSSEISPNVD